LAETNRLGTKQCPLWRSAYSLKGVSLTPEISHDASTVAGLKRT